MWPEMWFAMQKLKNLSAGHGAHFETDSMPSNMRGVF